MPTKKKRLSVSLPKKLYLVLCQIAFRDEVPAATKLVQLAEIAIEIEEDEYLNKIAEERDTTDATFISHKEFWNDVNGVQD